MAWTFYALTLVLAVKSVAFANGEAVRCALQENVQQVEQLINQQMHDSDTSNGLTKGLMNGPTPVWA